MTTVFAGHAKALLFLVLVAVAAAIALTSLSGRFLNPSVDNSVHASNSNQGDVVPEVSFTGPDESISEGQTISLQVALSSPATTGFEIRYSVDYPEDRSSRDYLDSVQVKASDNIVSIPIFVQDDDEVALRAIDTITVSLSDPGEGGDYTLGTPKEKYVELREGICDRSPDVRDAILSYLRKQLGDCLSVSDNDLLQEAFQQDFNLSSIPNGSPGGSRGVSSLKRRDFIGLSKLAELNLSNAMVTDLPDGVFDGLSSLGYLVLDDVALTEIDAGDFEGLSSLWGLDLSGNKLERLPAGLFVGKDKLRSFRFGAEGTEPLELSVDLFALELDSTGRHFSVVAKFPEGAPVPIKVTIEPFEAAEGEGSQTVTIAAGETESEAAWFSRSDEDFDIVNISLGPEEDEQGLSFGEKQIGDHSAVIGDFAGIKVVPGQWAEYPPIEINITSPEVFINEEPRHDTEESNLAIVSFSFSRPPENDFLLEYITTIDGDPDTDDAIKGEDYEAHRSYHVGPGFSGIRNIAIPDDGDVDDGPEVFVVELEEPSRGQAYILGSDVTSLVTIEDGTCDRSQPVQDMLTIAFSGMPGFSSIPLCSEMTRDDLKGLTGSLAIPEPADPNELLALKPGELRFLTKVQNFTMSWLNLSDGLPMGLFKDLNSVQYLNLSMSRIRELEAGIFDGLNSVSIVALSANELQDLPAGLFNDLPSLEKVWINDNGLSTIHGDAFGGATTLTELVLSRNELVTLPPGLFEGLTNLRTLNLAFNPGAPFTLTANIQDQGDGSFVVHIDEAAPFRVRVHYSVEHGDTRNVGSVIVPAGATESAPVVAAPDGDPSDTVTVSPSRAAWVGSRTITGVNLKVGVPISLNPR